jgi:hypothetical protein
MRMDRINKNQLYYFFKKYELKIISFLIFILLFVFYIILACPTVYWYDSGEFDAAGYTLGVTHPTGYPLFVLLLKAWGTVFPLSSPLGKIHDFAYRCNIMSGFFGALSCSMLFLIFMKIIAEGQTSKKNMSGKDGKIILELLSLKPDACDGIKITIGIFISLFLGIMPVFAGQSVVTEVYTLNIFFILMNINILLVWEKTNDRTKSLALLYSFSFLFGLSHANHMTSALMAPIYLVFIIRKLKTDFFKPRHWLVPLVLFIAGFFPYLFVISMSHNDISWFPIRNFEDFKYLFFARSYSRSLFFNKEMLINIGGGIFGWSVHFIKTQVLLFFGFYAFMIIGIFYIVRNHFSSMILVAGGFLIYLLYFSNYMPNNQDFYLPIFAFSMIFMGTFYVYFYSYFINDLKSVYKITLTVSFFIILLLMFSFQLHLTLTPSDRFIDIGADKKLEGPNKRNYSAAFDNAKRIADNVEDGSIVIFHGDTMAPVLYLEYCTDFKENKSFYHSLLYHFKKYGPLSNVPWQTTLDKELIKPALESGKNVYATLKDDAPSGDSILYGMMKILYGRGYEVRPIFDQAGFTSLGKISGRITVKPEDVEYADLSRFMNSSIEFNGAESSPLLLKNGKTEFISIDDETAIELKPFKRQIHGIVVLFGVKGNKEEITRLAGIRTGGNEYYINNITDCHVPGMNNDNYFPDNKIYEKQRGIFRKIIPLKPADTDRMIIKPMDKTVKIEIFAIGRY